MKKLAFLLKNTLNNSSQIYKYYTQYLNSDIKYTYYDILYNTQNKAPVSLIKINLPKILDNCIKSKIDLLAITSPEYFKYITKKRKVSFMHGEISSCKLPGYEQLKVIYLLNYQTLYFTPERKNEIQITLTTINNYFNNIIKPTKNFIHTAYYPKTFNEIVKSLQILHTYPVLTCDVETESLALSELKTIAFGINQHEGIAFPVNKKINNILADFFTHYKGTLIFHNAPFDIKQCIFNCFMHCHHERYDAILTGLDAFFPKVLDTKIITYLAKNSTSRISLGLKENSYEYTGNYSKDILKNRDILPLSTFLEYNLIDTLATWYVFNQNYPKLIQDNQLEIHDKLFQPSIRNITNMELIGVPLNIKKVYQVNRSLKREKIKYLRQLKVTPTIIEYNQTHKKIFNHKSSQQKRYILFEKLNLPVLDKTKTGLSSTASKVLQELNIFVTQNPTQYPADTPIILNALRELNIIDQALDLFIHTFITKHIKDEQGNCYIQGNFNIGGTVSGRESSSNPNLQNIPVNSLYGKLIKNCFEAPTGWIICGADFDGLEDKIAALTTKDPNRLKVFTDGYDGHCLRAFYYYGNQMPDIVETVQSINSIKTKYPKQRQDSKSPTFALTYKGTWKTLVKKFGFSEINAKKLTKQYHLLYQVSDEWVKNKLQTAIDNGYIDVAFGLRIRTPTLHNAIIDSKKTPYFIHKDYKTIANALGQSYGLLNNRAANEFSERLKNSPYLYDVKPILHIHDAQYYLVKWNSKIIHWVNKNLIECMEWQNLPEIYHPDVKLGGKLELYYPTQGQSTSLPNNASEEYIEAILNNF